MKTEKEILTTKLSVTDNIDDFTSFFIGNMPAAIVVYNLQVPTTCKTNIGWLKKSLSFIFIVFTCLERSVGFLHTVIL